MDLNVDANFFFPFVVRTGQAHRTLVGHTAPVSCLQFDEYHLVSGSLDKSVRVSNSFFFISFPMNTF